MFAAGVWEFGTGGVEGGGDVEMFFCFVLDICQIKVEMLKSNYFQTLGVGASSHVAVEIF